jgi:hypothetical protein
MSIVGFFTGFAPSGFTAYFPGSGQTSPKLPPFEVDLVAYLTGVGLGVSIYPGHIPQKADPSVPAISFLAVSEQPRYTLMRASGMTSRNYQFSTWSRSYLTSCAVELALRDALHGFRGLMGSTPVSACRLQQCLDLPFEPDVDESDEGTYQRVSEYRIAFQEIPRQFGRGF